MFSLQLELYVFLYGYFSLQQRHSEKVGFKVILNKVELLGSSSSFNFFHWDARVCDSIYCKGWRLNLFSSQGEEKEV